MDDFDWIFSDETIEADFTIQSRMKRAELRRRKTQALKLEKLSEFFMELPDIDESFHFISNGEFDYFTFLPKTIDLLGGKIEYFYGSTWTMNRNNVIELFDLFDRKKIVRMAILTGLYFKRRESSVYATLVNGMMDRKQHYRALGNHAKIMLLNNDEDYIVIEGSANFTANPRIEQLAVINSYDLWQFHKKWMDECLYGASYES